MPPCSSIPAAGQDHADACDGGARSSLRFAVETLAEQRLHCRAHFLLHQVADDRQQALLSRHRVLLSGGRYTNARSPAKAVRQASQLQEKHAGGLLMAKKLREMAQARWRRLDGASLVPLVRATIGFVDGVQQEGKVSKPKAKAA